MRFFLLLGLISTSAMAQVQVQLKVRLASVMMTGPITSHYQYDPQTRSAHLNLEFSTFQTNPSQLYLRWMGKGSRVFYRLAHGLNDAAEPWRALPTQDDVLLDQLIRGEQKISFEIRVENVGPDCCQPTDFGLLLTQTQG